MKKLIFAAYLSFVFAAALVGAETPPPLRIMPLGDSITYGSSTAGGYRLPLYLALTAAGYNIDYVGNETGNSATGLGAEINHEGHGGWRISAGSNGIYENILGWLDRIDDPDVVLLHVGTNDTNDSGFEEKINKYNDLILRIAEARPYAHIIATTLLKRGANDSDSLYTKIKTQFNPYVEDLVAAHQAAGRRVHFLDMHEYLERSDMYDNLHPTADGYGKMADAWYPAIAGIVGHYGDSLPPGVASVKVTSATQLTVTFSKPLDAVASSAVLNPASYSIAPLGSVTAVSELSSDQRKIVLTISGVPQMTESTLTINAAISDSVPEAEGGPYSTLLNQSVAFIAQPPTPYAEDVVEPEVLDGWRALYTLDIPSGVRYGRERVNYKLDNSATLNKIPLSRVAYYMALQRSGEPLQYVWVELDAFEQDSGKLGVPTTASGAFFQQYLSNLKVVSNSPYVTEGEFASGNIEFWPCNYQPNNDFNIPGASEDLYDFGDRASDGDHGSMQIHNTALGETLFAFNNWGKSLSDGSAATPGIGIGTNPDASSTSSGAQRDWTFAGNAGQFSVRVLQVFVKEATGSMDVAAPVVESAYTGFDGRQIAVHFSEPLWPSTVSSAAFNLSDGVVVESATLGRESKVVVLRTSVQPAGQKLTLSVSGVRALRSGLAVPATPITVGWLPPEVEADIGAAADGYRVVYGLDIGVVTDFGGTAPAPYFFNASDTAMKFDRVAYYLGLGQRYMCTPERLYAWTAMDAFTPWLSKIGVPNYAAKATFGQLVTNLVVRSNKSGVVNGAFERGNIEFWPSNYSAGNTAGIPNASGSNLDFGDGGYSTSVGHGSMQVHNYLELQTVFSISGWGDNRSDPAGVGIGNSPANETTNSTDKDWSHAKNAPFYSSRRLYVLAKLPEFEIDPMTPPAEVVERVPEAAGYKHLYTVEIPAIANFSDSSKRAGYYTVDNSVALGDQRCARVAYFMELVSNSVTSYCWTAFNTMTPDLAKLGVPTGDNYFWQTITNLDVRSNVSGVVNVTGSSSGNIEFCDWDYSSGNALNIPGASGSTYDFGDTRASSRSGAYGSMQVHNHGEEQTLWALNRFNHNSERIGIGIGNRSTGNPDWTFAANGNAYDSRRLLVFIEPAPAGDGMRPVTSLPAEVVERVPAVTEYEHLYTIEIPAEKAQFHVQEMNDSYYTVDNSARLDVTFDRVGYFMELVRDGVTNYCWTAFEPFTHTLKSYGVPRGSVTFKHYVRNMDVISNVGGVVNTTGCDTGNIEFWDSSYNASASWGIPGGSGTLYDFDDNPTGGSGGYGSMQVHNWGEKQTLWALNRFNHASEPVSIGIGSQATGNPDWTFAANGKQFDSRRLLVFIRPNTGTQSLSGYSSTRPKLDRAIGQVTLNRVLVFFDRAVQPETVNVANFSANNGLQISAAVMHPMYGDSCVVLTTSEQSASTSYEITVSGVKSANLGGFEMFPNQKISFTAQTEAGARPALLSSVPEAAAYKLLYKLPVDRVSNWSLGARYTLDESWPEAVRFDRVAYLLDLPLSDGTPNWVWVSMEPFTMDALRLGIPTIDRSVCYQQYVSDIKIVAAPQVSTLTPGEYASGNIEFWPNSYSYPNNAGISGASGSLYDFGDQVTGSAPTAGHGSFQIHNFGLGETLLAINSWGAGLGDLATGIGTNPNGSLTSNSGSAQQLDWTFSKAYTQYATRTLYVFVRPEAEAPVEDLPEPGWGTTPTILLSPADRAADAGEMVELRVIATDATRYQWRLNGQYIPEATGDILLIPAVAGRDVGSYDVMVFGNGSRYVVSEPALVRVPRWSGTMILVR